MTPNQLAYFAMTLVQVAACGYILYIVSLVLNHMSKRTRETMRWSYLSFAVAALSGILSDATLSTCLFSAGVALYLACNERSHHAPERKSAS